MEDHSQLGIFQLTVVMMIAACLAFALVFSAKKGCKCRERTVCAAYCRGHVQSYDCLTRICHCTNGKHVRF